jgi:ABC-type branched-subunit amino acid transport system permease subunit
LLVTPHRSVFLFWTTSRELGDPLAPTKWASLCRLSARPPSACAYLSLTILILAVYKRFVDSPTARVRGDPENERARMLGYNTFIFKLSALLISSFTAALAGVLHTLYQPIVSPNIASMAFTVTALLITLIGGVGTLSGALVGAFIYRLLDFGLRRYIGESASFINGAIWLCAPWHRGNMALITNSTGERLKEPT